MTIELPSLSVVIPTRSRPAELSRCLAAICDLDHPCYEVIVVDDGGSAPLERVLEPFRERLTVSLLSQSRAGPAAARNKGALAAGGDLLAFVDDDVVLDRGWASAVCRQSLVAPGAGIGGRTENLLSDNPYSGTSERIIELAYEHYNSGSAGARFFAANNIAFPGEGFRAIGGFDASFRTSEDRDLCHRWVASGRPLVYAPDAIARHAPPLTLRGFARQQFGYGRGAFNYHRTRIRRERRSSELSVSFYGRVLREAGGELRAGHVRKVGLLGLWQLANLAGFSYEAAVALTRGLRRRRRLVDSTRAR